MNELHVSKNIDYSYLILQNGSKVFDFISKYGLFVTDAGYFWQYNKDKFKNFSEEEQIKLFNSLCEIEKYCLDLLRGDSNE